jgi:alkylhydroperoxidase/carboxymuconolactone decarboxylase family protein YurZ
MGSRARRAGLTGHLPVEKFCEILIDTSLFAMYLRLKRGKGTIMEDLHKIFTKFKKEFSKVHSDFEALGKEIHEKSGPLTPKTCWLIKIAISATSRHQLALETHIMKAKEAGVTDDEMKHALLLLIQTAGFPTFMEAYSVYDRLSHHPR